MPRSALTPGHTTVSGAHTTPTDVDLRDTGGRRPATPFDRAPSGLILLSLNGLDTVRRFYGATTYRAAKTLVGGRIRSRVRAGDGVSWTRNGTFRITLGTATSRTDAAALAADLCARIMLPLTANGHEINLQVSSGVAGTEPGATAAGLLSTARCALRDAETAYAVR